MLGQGLGAIVNWRRGECGNNILSYSALYRSPRVYLVIDTKCVSEEAEGERKTNDLSPELPLSAQNQHWFPSGCVLLISPWSADHRLELGL